MHKERESWWRDKVGPSFVAGVLVLLIGSIGSSFLAWLTSTEEDWSMNTAAWALLGVAIGGWAFVGYTLFVPLRRAGKENQRLEADKATLQKENAMLENDRTNLEAELARLLGDLTNLPPIWFQPETYEALQTHGHELRLRFRIRSEHPEPVRVVKYGWKQVTMEGRSLGPVHYAGDALEVPQRGADWTSTSVSVPVVNPPPPGLHTMELREGYIELTNADGTEPRTLRLDVIRLSVFSPPAA